MSAEPNDEFITLARVVKTQGRHGEVAAEVHSDIPDRFTEGMKLLALERLRRRRELEVEELWPHKGLLVLKFRGIDSISDAETSDRIGVAGAPGGTRGTRAGLDVCERFSRLHGVGSAAANSAPSRMFSLEPAKRRC